jgi:hypothetical protein
MKIWIFKLVGTKAYAEPKYVLRSTPDNINANQARQLFRRETMGRLPHLTVGDLPQQQGGAVTSQAIMDAIRAAASNAMDTTIQEPDLLYSGNNREEATAAVKRAQQQYGPLNRVKYPAANTQPEDQA